MSVTHFRNTLERLAESGDRVRLWLRDDDAVDPTPALDRLLALSARYAVPVTLAVIPENTGDALAKRLETVAQARVAVHGWSHRNHAMDGEKKQELDGHRPAEAVHAELKAGFEKLAVLHPARFTPMLVPPWNRIAPTLMPVPGYEALSVFGPEKPGSLMRVVNTHVDVMDWHGTRGGRPADELFAELAGWLDRKDRPPAIGVLTHHLVHDEAVWEFLDRLFAETAAHPACAWVAP